MPYEEKSTGLHRRNWPMAMIRFSRRNWSPPANYLDHWCRKRWASRPREWAEPTYIYRLKQRPKLAAMPLANEGNKGFLETHRRCALERLAPLRQPGWGLGQGRSLSFANGAEHPGRCPIQPVDIDLLTQSTTKDRLLGTTTSRQCAGHAAHDVRSGVRRGHGQNRPGKSVGPRPGKCKGENIASVERHQPSFENLPALIRELAPFKAPFHSLHR